MRTPLASPEPLGQLLTVEDVADRLQIGRTRTFALIKSGEIRSLKLGTSRRVTVEALLEFQERLSERAAS